MSKIETYNCITGIDAHMHQCFSHDNCGFTAMRQVDSSPCSSIGDLTGNPPLRAGDSHLPQQTAEGRPNINTNNIQHTQHSQVMRSVSNDTTLRGIDTSSPRSVSIEGEAVRTPSARTSLNSSLASSPTLKSKGK